MVGDVPSEVTNRANRTLRDSAKGQFRPRTLIGDMSASRLEVPKTDQSDPETVCQQSAPIPAVQAARQTSRKPPFLLIGRSASAAFLVRHTAVAALPVETVE